MLRAKRLLISCSLLLLILLSGSPIFAQSDPELRTVGVLGTLKIGDVFDINSQKSQEAWKQTESLLAAFAKAGGEDVEVDVWIGLFFNGQGRAYYKRLFDLIEKYKLHIAPMISNHKLGGNIGDGPEPIYIPQSIISEDILYRGFNNRLNKPAEESYDAAVAPWVWDFNAKEKLKDFMIECRDFFAQYSSIREIAISTGTAGELRNASYTKDSYPGPGELMVYSEPAIQKFRDYAKQVFNNDINELNKELSMNPGLQDFDQLYPPTGDNFFNQGLQFSKYGEFFFTFYNQMLVDHGRNWLELAIEVFGSDPASQFKKRDLELAIKIGGIHWNYNEHTPNDYGLAAMFAGYLVPNKPETYGYKKIFNMVKEESDRFKAVGGKGIRVDYTAVEKNNEEHYSNGVLVVSRAGDLVKMISMIAQQTGVKLGAENATPSYYHSNFWKNISNAVNDGYKEVTFLRLENFKDPKILQDLTNFITEQNALYVSQVLNKMPRTRNLDELVAKYPKAFTYKVFNSYIESSLLCSNRKDAVDILTKSKNVIKRLNRPELNCLTSTISKNEQVLYQRDLDLLLNRIADYYGYDKNKVSETLIPQLIDHLINNRNGNIDEDPEKELLSTILLGTIEDDKRDNLIAWADELKVPQAKTDFLCMLFLGNNHKIDFLKNGVLVNTEIGKRIAFKSHNGLKLTPTDLQNMNIKFSIDIINQNYPGIRKSAQELTPRILELVK